MRPPRVLSRQKTHLRTDRIVNPHGLKPLESIVGLLPCNCNVSSLLLKYGLARPRPALLDVISLGAGFAAFEAFPVAKHLVATSAFLALITPDAAAIFAPVHDTATLTATLCSLALTRHDFSSFCFVRFQAHELRRNHRDKAPS